jgi:hypothetical protein
MALRFAAFGFENFSVLEVFFETTDFDFVRVKLQIVEVFFAMLWWMLGRRDASVPASVGLSFFFALLDLVFFFALLDLVFFSPCWT